MSIQDVIHLFPEYDHGDCQELVETGVQSPTVNKRKIL